MLMNGMPVAALLLESSLAGMMWGIERMVGLERFQLAMRGDEFDEFAVAPSEQSVEIEERRAGEERLLREAEERQRVEAELRGKLELIERQAEDIQAMATPILQVWSHVSPRTAEVAATLGVDLKGLTSHATLEGALQEALRGMSKR